MALKKAIVSERTGATVEHHEVTNVLFLSLGKVQVQISSYINTAAKIAGKTPVDGDSITADYDGSVIGKTIAEFGETVVLASEKYAGATEV